MMKLLVDHQVFSLQDTGGASRYHFELLKHLVNQHAVEAMLLLGSHSNTNNFCTISGLQVWQVPRFLRLPAGYARYVMTEVLASARLLLHQQTFEIYHSTYYRYMPVVRHRRLVATHHDCVQERFPGLFRNTRQIMRAKAKLFAAADAIICISESSRKDLHQYYAVDPAKTFVIHHGVSDMAAWEPQPRLPGEFPSFPYLLYVGGRSDYKNFSGFVRALAHSRRLGEMHVVAVGGGPLTAGERRHIDEVGLENRIHVVPASPGRVLARMYAGATVFVYPSLCEGFGFPPLEAMQMGCVTAVANTSSMPEVCGDAAFYFDPASEDSIQTVLEQAVSDESARSAKRAKGKIVAAQYRWTTCAAKTFEVFEAVLEQRMPRFDRA